MALPAGGAGSSQPMRLDDISEHAAPFVGPVGDDNLRRGLCGADSTGSHIFYGKGVAGNHTWAKDTFGYLPLAVRCWPLFVLDNRGLF